MAKKFSKLKRSLCPQIQETQGNYTQDEHKAHLGVSQEDGGTGESPQTQRRRARHCEMNVNGQLSS